MITPHSFEDLSYAPDAFVMMQIPHSNTSQMQSFELRSGDCGGHLTAMNLYGYQSEMIKASTLGLSCVDSFRPVVDRQKMIQIYSFCILWKMLCSPFTIHKNGPSAPCMPWIHMEPLIMRLGLSSCCLCQPRVPKSHADVITIPTWPVGFPCERIFNFSLTHSQAASGTKP